MNTRFSSTIGATSNVADRVAEAISRTEKRIDVAKLARLREFQNVVGGLKARGLLTPQKLTVTTTAEFEKLYQSQVGPVKLLRIAKL